MFVVGVNTGSHIVDINKNNRGTRILPCDTPHFTKPGAENSLLYLFVCLGFIVPLGNFHSYGNVTITSEGLKIFTYARHSWPLSSEGSLTCHTYCDTGIRL